MPAGVHITPGRALPALPAPLVNAPGQCNAGMPADSTLARFAFVVSFLAANKFHVVCFAPFGSSSEVLAVCGGSLRC